MPVERAAQRAAQQALGGRPGAIVALDTRSRRVLVWAGAGGVDPGRTLVPPGSTYKTLVAAAALDAGVIGPATRLDGDGRLGLGVVNAGGARLGAITVATALERSTTSAIADVARRLGARRLTAAARRVGYFARPTAGRPVAASGRPMAQRDLFAADGRFIDPDETQRSSALQLALLAASFADGRVWKPGTAATVREGMRRAVRTGTAQVLGVVRPAAAAKTGTTRVDGGTQANVIVLWPARRPRVALAVLLRDPVGRTGGEAAAPLALPVLRALGAR